MIYSTRRALNLRLFVFVGGITLKTKPITRHCNRNLDSKIHACFGISPFNSYFSEARIRELALWGKNKFNSMHFFIPDIPSVYTLEALGYDSEKAAWKARRQCQYLHNKTYKALRDVGFTGTRASDMVLNWETLSSNQRFLALYNEVKTLFELDSSFQTACLEASNWVLERRVPEGKTLTLEMLRSAARYLLAEIPLFLDTAGIVEKESSVFCYHQSVKFLDDLFNKRLTISPSGSQGFVVIEPQPSNLLIDSSTSRELKESVI